MQKGHLEHFCRGYICEAEPYSRKTCEKQSSDVIPLICCSEFVPAIIQVCSSRNPEVKFFSLGENLVETPVSVRIQDLFFFGGGGNNFLRDFTDVAK